MSELSPLIQRLPKAELHLHLEGSIPPSMALKLAKRSGIELPCEVYENGEVSGRYFISDFMETFLPLYLAISSCLNTVDDFVLALDGLASELARQNVPYAEVTFTPMTHVKRGVSPDTILVGLREGREQAFANHNVRLNWVFDIVRIFPDQAPGTLEIALAGQKDGVVALGLGGPEQGSAKALAQFFRQAKSEGLKSVPHAGEQAGPENVWEALQDLEADRIGHGFRSIEDPELIAHLREREIPLEICVSSNLELGLVPSLAEHPLPRLLKAGVPLSLASDDPPFFGTSINQEYRRCAEAFSLSRSQVFDLAQASVRQSFMPPELKSRLLLEQEQLFSAANGAL